MTAPFCHPARVIQVRAGLLAVALICLIAVLPGTARAQAHAAVVMDMRSGEILHARNHDTRLHPASLTKMMTLYIAFEAIANGEITLDTPVTTSRNAASEPCSCLGLRAGQSIALRHLIRAAAVRSGNDAATAIGEAISGSEAAFAARMTRTAHAMGMTNTTFRNAHGLTHPEHLSTARDMTILGRQLFFDYPQYYNLFSRRSTHAGIAQINNTNRRFLDSYRGSDGIKTGYTRAAGFNLTASAERGGVRIITTVFGGGSVADRNARTAELMDMGFARASRQVAVSRPARPAYDPGGTRTITLASNEAAAAAPRAAGRVIRLNTAVRRSLRPMPRPVDDPPEELLIALQEEIGATLEKVLDAESATESVAVAAEVPIVPEPRPEELLADAAEALQAPDQPEAQVPTEEAELALLAQAAGFSVATEADEALLAALEDEGVTRAQHPEPNEMPESSPESRARPEASGTAAAPVAPERQPGQTAIPTASPFIILTSTPPPPRPDDLREIAVASASLNMVSEGEVVSRLSTSGGRIWGINIGSYGSRHEAERLLMQTALSEIGTLEGGLRRVVQRSGRFDATFAGLTMEQADLACRRLQARGKLCFTVGP